MTHPNSDEYQWRQTPPDLLAVGLCGHYSSASKEMIDSIVLHGSIQSHPSSRRRTANRFCAMGYMSGVDLGVDFPDGAVQQLHDEAGSMQLQTDVQ
jgi:hypothetical protein